MHQGCDHRTCFVVGQSVDHNWQEEQKRWKCQTMLSFRRWTPWEMSSLAILHQRWSVMVVVGVVVVVVVVVLISDSYTPNDKEEAFMSSCRRPSLPDTCREEETQMRWSIATTSRPLRLHQDQEAV